MSKKKIVTTKKKGAGSDQNRVVPTTSRSNRNTTVTPDTLIFGKKNYMFMGIGFGLILLGMLLMSGGGMEDPNTWDPSVIYSTRRTLIAPIVILSGLVLQIYAIFVKETPVLD